jgi:hypothetical protein
MGTLAHCLVHPEAGRTFLTTAEYQFADSKALANQRIQVDAGNEHIPPHYGAIKIIDTEVLLQCGRYLIREKSNLTFVVLRVAKVPVTLYSHSRGTGNRFAGHDAVILSSLAVSPLEIMARRNPDFFDSDAHGASRSRAHNPGTEYTTCAVDFLLDGLREST